MHPLPKTLNFHLWFPNIFGFKGGIQVYSAFLLKALQEISPNSIYDVFLKHDTQHFSKFACVAPTKFYFSGSWPLSVRTFVFAFQLLGHGLWKKPSLVITTHLNFARVAYWLKHLRGVRYWVIAHGNEAWNIKDPTLKIALYYADQILSVSSYTRDRLLREQDLDPAKVSLLPNTFDAGCLKPTPKPSYLLKQYKLTATQPVILTVTRLDESRPYKGYYPILKALPKIRSQLPDVHYVLVGKGNDRTNIEQLINQLGLQDCVTLAGFVPDNQLCDYYNLCDVFAMPSKGEGFGIVYLEALACGKPTLGSNQDGAIDALCHGELGALVDPNNVEAVAQTITQILCGSYPHPVMYDPKALRQRVIEIYGCEKFKQTLSELLEDYFLEKAHRKK